MSSAQNTKANAIDRLINGGSYNHLWSLSETCVNHFHPGIAKCSGDDFCAAIMPIQTGFSNKDTYLLGRVQKPTSLWLDNEGLLVTI